MTGTAPAGHRNQRKTGRHPPGTHRTADTSPPHLYTRARPAQPRHSPRTPTRQPGPVARPEQGEQRATVRPAAGDGLPAAGQAHQAIGPATTVPTATPTGRASRLDRSDLALDLSRPCPDLAQRDHLANAGRVLLFASSHFWFSVESSPWLMIPSSMRAATDVPATSPRRPSHRSHWSHCLHVVWHWTQ
jgi:hypothetical protein